MDDQAAHSSNASSFPKRPRKRFGAQGLVEFAIIGPVFLMLLFGVVEMGRLIWTNHELDNGTREGARYAMVHGAKSGTLATSATVKTYMLSHTSGLSSAKATVNVAYGGTAQPGDVVTVSSTYSFTPLVSMVLGTGTINLTSTAKVIVQH
jgi:Flp pilus assembly protein TadG